IAIRNKYLEVQADRKTGEITILARGKPVLTKVHLGPEGKEATASLAPREFKSDSIKIDQLDANFSAAVGLLRDDSSPLSHFVLICPFAPNNGKAPIEINHLPIFQGNVSVSDSPDAIRVLGTGGLTKPGKLAGSYMWLAAAEPATRHGIVAGFIATDR